MFKYKKLTQKDIYNTYAITGLNIDAVEEFLKEPNIFNPFNDKLQIESENRGLREIYLMYNPDYLYYTAKFLLNIELYPLQCLALENLWKYAFPLVIGSRGFSKSFLLAVYAILRAVLFQGSKIIVAGSAFRQAKYVYEYIESIWENAPILQSIFKQYKPSARLPDYWKFTIGDSQIIAIPIGTGDKIRGLRANILLCDEFNSISLEIYEVVLSQFAAVSMSPIENMRQIATRKLLAQKGLAPDVESRRLSYFNNQSVITGTLRFEFEPLAIYWRKYKEIIESKGDKLIEQFGEIGENLDWKDFSIVRVPYELIPEGFMDAKIVARAKATMHHDYYKAEYGCVPISDTMGFYKRTLIESCVAKNSNIAKDTWPAWCPDAFEPLLQGSSKKSYTMGVDPAYNQDNFAIVITEMHPEHARVVYVWSTSKKLLQKQNVDEKNYFNFCARKIRDLCRVFKIEAIGIDTQGGGYTIIEALHDKDKIQQGEVPLWPVILPDKEQDTDDYAGAHIIHLIQFSDANWTATANHGMKKDMEGKLLLFPEFNGVLLGLASEKERLDVEQSVIGQSDSLTDCMLEIEELKNELSLVIRETTPAGRERWTTPPIKLSTNRKEYMRKDRYSALLIANYLARTIQRTPPVPEYRTLGAARGTAKKPDTYGRLYSAPDWYQVSPDLFKSLACKFGPRTNS